MGEKAEVITATELTAGEVNEGNRLTSSIDARQQNAGHAVETVVGDNNRGRRKDIFEPSDFVYNPDDDLFICPAEELLLHFGSQCQEHRKAAAMRAAAGSFRHPFRVNWICNCWIRFDWSDNSCSICISG